MGKQKGVVVATTALKLQTKIKNIIKTATIQKMRLLL
jgi:hypothetical protein